MNVNQTLTITLLLNHGFSNTDYFSLMSPNTMKRQKRNVFLWCFPTGSPSDPRRGLFTLWWSRALETWLASCVWLYSPGKHTWLWKCIHTVWSVYSDWLSTTLTLQQADVVVDAAAPHETMRQERVRQRENTEGDELDLYETFMVSWWGGVGGNWYLWIYNEFWWWMCKDWGLHMSVLSAEERSVQGKEGGGQ